MRVCSNCSNSLNDSQVYCPKCGTHNPVVEAEQEAREELDNYFNEGQDDLDRGIDSEEILSESTSSNESVSEFSLQENAPIITDEEPENASETEFENTFGHDDLVENTDLSDEERFENTFDNDFVANQGEDLHQEAPVQEDSHEEASAAAEVEQAEHMEAAAERGSDAANDNTFAFGYGASTPTVNPTQYQQSFNSQQNTTYNQNPSSSGQGYGQTGQTYYNSQNQYQSSNQNQNTNQYQRQDTYSHQNANASAAVAASKEELEFAETGLPAKYKPLPFWEYLIYAVVAMIPLGTLLIFIYSIIAAAQNDNIHRKNWGIGQLILAAIALIIGIIGVIILLIAGTMILSSFMRGAGY